MKLDLNREREEFISRIKMESKMFIDKLKEQALTNFKPKAMIQYEKEMKAKEEND